MKAKHIKPLLVIHGGAGGKAPTPIRAQKLRGALDSILEDTQ